jgi:hypothetical protein
LSGLRMETSDIRQNMITTVILLLEIHVTGHNRLAKPFVPNEIEGWLEYLSPLLHFDDKSFRQVNSVPVTNYELLKYYNVYCSAVQCKTILKERCCYTTYKCRSIHKK